MDSLMDFQPTPSLMWGLRRQRRFTLEPQAPSFTAQWQPERAASNSKQRDYFRRLKSHRPEQAGFRQGRIFAERLIRTPGEPLRHADLQRIAARLQCFGDVHAERRLPQNSQIVTVELHLRHHLHRAEIEPDLGFLFSGFARRIPIKCFRIGRPAGKIFYTFDRRACFWNRQHGDCRGRNPHACPHTAWLPNQQ